MSSPGIAMTGVLLLPVAALSAEAQGLRHDPFQPPALLQAATPTSPRTAASPAQAAEEAKLEAQLHAVITSPAVSLVNVDGEILQLREEYQGYRLVEIHERSAVFEKAGRRQTLSLDKHDDTADK